MGTKEPLLYHCTLQSHSVKGQVASLVPIKRRCATTTFAAAKMTSSSSSLKTVNTQLAPQPIGPYSQAVQCGNLVFTAGQIGKDVETDSLAGDSAETQAYAAMKNLQRVLEASNSSLEKVIKVTVFLTDMNDFAAVNKVYSKFFGDDEGALSKGHKPARSCVAVAALPAGAKFEVEAVA